MGTITEIVVRGDSGLLSPNQRLHYRTEAKLKKEWRESAAWIARELGWPKVGRKIRISCTIRRWRKTDPFNARASGALKALEDGLVDAGIVPDDTEEFVTWGDVKQEAGRQFRFREEVVVLIEVMEESNGTGKSGRLDGSRDLKAKGTLSPRKAGDGKPHQPPAGAGRKGAAARRKPGSRKAPGGPQ